MDTVTEPTASLPAASRMLRWAVTAPSPETTSSAGHETTPERVSAQVQWMVTGPLYQPLPLGEVVAAPEMVGTVLSSLMPVTEAAVELSAASNAVPEAESPVPSVESVDDEGQVAMPDVASEHV